jgi:threonine dehydrogenase-like Zn-dependent dehydrogenase
MRGAVLYARGDVRVEEREDPRIVEPTDAVLRVGDLATRAPASTASPSAPKGPRPSACGSRWPTAPWSPPRAPPDDLVPSLLAASDVLGTGWFGAVAAAAGPGKTVAVVGDGAVGLLAVLAARQLGAGRIIAMSRRAPRQQLAVGFGATDVVSERGQDGVARVKELTGGLGAHSVVEAVGTTESMLQAIGSTRPGGHVGVVGVAHGWDRRIDPGRVFGLELPLAQAAEGYRAMDERRAINTLLRP